jgi:hypothetical protein
MGDIFFVQVAKARGFSFVLRQFRFHRLGMPEAAWVVSGMPPEFADE